MILAPLSLFLLVVSTDFHTPEAVGLPGYESGQVGRASIWNTVEYEYFELVPAMVTFTSVGLLNLAPLLWILSPHPGVRTAGVFTGLLGAVHLAIPLTLLFTVFPRFTNPDGVAHFRNTAGFVSEIDLLDLGWPVLGGLTWYVSALGWWVFGRTRSTTKSSRLKMAECGVGAVVLAGVAFGFIIVLFSLSSLYI